MTTLWGEDFFNNHIQENLLSSLAKVRRLSKSLAFI